jgi:hypothetical protein
MNLAVHDFVGVEILARHQSILAQLVSFVRREIEVLADFMQAARTVGREGGIYFWPIR